MNFFIAKVVEEAVSPNYLPKMWAHLQFSPWLFQLQSDWGDSHMANMTVCWIHRAEYVSINRIIWIRNFLSNITFRKSQSKGVIISSGLHHTLTLAIFCSLIIHTCDSPGIVLNICDCPHRTMIFYK